MKNWNASGFYESSNTNLGSIVSTQELNISGSTFANNGYNYDATKYAVGAGVIYSTGENIVTLQSSVFRNNQVYAPSGPNSKGGVLYALAEKGVVSVADSLFENNRSSSGNGTAYAGVFRIQNSITNATSAILLRVTDSVFRGNSVGGGNAAYGGVTSSAGKVELVIENSVFDSNSANAAKENYGGVFTVSGLGTFINSTFTNNSATGTKGNGGAISYNGTGLKIIADGGNTLFKGNTAARGADIRTANNGSAVAGAIYLNAAAGNTVSFFDGIYSENSNQVLAINASTVFNDLTTPLTYSNYAGDVLNAPTAGTVNLNASVQNLKLYLYGGTLAINSEGTAAPDFSTVAVTLTDGMLDLQNGVIDSLTFKSLLSTQDVSFDFDADLSTGISDSITLSSNIQSGQAIFLDSINIIADGDASSVTVFKNQRSPTLTATSSYSRTFTNLKRYDFTPSATTKGVLDITSVILDPDETGLSATVADTSSSRTFSITADETEKKNLGAMAGGNNAVMSVYGNAHSIDGADFDGITVGATQKASVYNVDNWNNFQTTGNGGAFSNAGTLTVSLTDFANNEATGSGGVVYNTGVAQINGGTYMNNTAAINGGAFYNTGILTLETTETISGNTATAGNGGAIYNAAGATLTLSIADGSIVFTGNTANGAANDIHNDGTINLVGANNNLTLDGGITGSSAGNIIMSGKGNLIVNGGLDGYMGTFTQSLGTTTVNGTLFNGAVTLTGGSMTLAGTLSANSVLNVGENAVLNITSANNMTFGANVLSGTGTVSKSGANTLTVAGDNSGFTGTFEQTAGTTVVQGALFDGLVHVRGTSTIDFEDGGAFSADTVVQLDAGTTMIYGGATDLTITGGVLVGDGAFNKTGTGKLTVTGDFSDSATYTGTFTQTAGTTLINLDNFSFGGAKYVNGGTMQTTGDYVETGMNVGNDGASVGTWNHNSTVASDVTVSSANLTFTGTGATAVFGRNASLAATGELAYYVLTENIQNTAAGALNTIGFTDSRVHLDENDYTGNTQYTFTNSVIDMTNDDSALDELRNFKFDSLTVTNTDVALDLSFNGTTLQSDTLTATTAGFVGLDSVRLLNDAGVTATVTVLGGGLQFTSGETLSLATSAGNTYNVTVNDTLLVLTKDTDPANLYTSNADTVNTTRAFNFLNGVNYDLLNTETQVVPQHGLSAMAAGEFTVQGAGIYQSGASPSGSNLNAHEVYLFNINANAVTFKLKDLTVASAYTTLLNGAVLNLNNASSSALIQNVAIIGSTAVNGGAIWQAAGTLTVENTLFNGNASTQNGGTAVLNTGTFASSVFNANTAAQNGGALYINGGGNVTVQGGSSFTDNTATNGKGGAIYNEGTLTLDASGGNISFTGNSANGLANDIYSTGTVNIQGATNTVSLSVIAGTGTVNKSGTSVLTLNGNNNYFKGTFTQSSGVTNVNGSFFGGTNTVSGGVLNWNINVPKLYNLTMTNGTLNVEAAKILSLSEASVISSVANINISDTGTLNNAGSVTLNQGDRWAGTINNIGSVTLDGFSHLTNTMNSYTQAGASSSLTLINGSSLILNSGTDYASNEIAAGSVIIGAGTTGSILSIFEFDAFAPDLTLQLDAGNTLRIGNADETGGNVTFNAGDTWTGTVAMSSGTLTYADLTSNGVLQAYAGTVNVNSGNLTFGTNGVLGGDVAFTLANGATTTVNGGNVVFGNAFAWNGALVLQNGTLDFSAYSNETATGTFSQTGGASKFNNGSVITVDSAAFSVTGGAVTVSNSTMNYGTGATFTPALFALENNALLNLSADAVLPNVNMEISASTVNMQNGVLKNMTVGTLALGDGGANFAVDVDENLSDTLTIADLTTITGVSTINVSSFAFLNPLQEETESFSWQIFNAPASLYSDVFFTTTAPGVQTVYGIYNLYSEGNGLYTARLMKISPSIERGAVALEGMNLQQPVLNEFLFDRYFMPDVDEFASFGTSNATGKSAGDDYDDLFSPDFGEEDDSDVMSIAAAWLRPYMFTDDSNKIRSVDSTSWGVMGGVDFAPVRFDGGWAVMPTLYAGIQTTEQKYDDVQNNLMSYRGGLLVTAKKENWRLGATVFGGYYDARLRTNGYTDKVGYGFIGGGAKIAYDSRLTDSLIFQPSASFSVTRFKSSAWVSKYGDMQMRTGTMEGFDVLGGGSLIYARGNKKLFVSAAYGYGHTSAVEAQAGIVDLSMKTDRQYYGEYGIGGEIRWNDAFSSQAKVKIRDADRNNVFVSFDVIYRF